MADARTVIAVVDDDAAFGELVLDIVASEGHAGSIVPPRGNVVERLRRLRPALIVMDWRLGEGQEGATAEPLLRRIADEPELSGIPVVVCSADTTALRQSVPALAEDLRVSVLEKPFAVDEFVEIVSRALRRDADG